VTKQSMLAAALLLAAAGAAQARDVQWSIGVHLPVYPAVMVGVSNAPVYPIYRPAPVMVVPQPVYVERPRVVYVPQPVYVRQRVVYAPVWMPPGHAKKHWKGKHQPRWDRDDDDD
jgi:hypothetical protein